jgi:hypothetical protein
MKFKSQVKQNQLFENVTINHLVIGVNIAQEIHVARAVNLRDITLGNPLEFSNDEVGFTAQQAILHAGSLQFLLVVR